ncbi:MAG: purine-nucleoside phosphorylase [candidate division WOR-3 bacterium]
MRERLKKTVGYLNNYIKEKPITGIILGTGLDGLVGKLKIIHALDYKKIPEFPVATVEFHKGRLIYGYLSKKKVIVMQGRFHFYEGYSAFDVAYPVVVMKLLGVRYLIVTNAAGGLNPLFAPGDLMLITDHINLIPDNPLRGPNELKLGPRFVDMFNAYDHGLIKLAEAVALKNGFLLKKGVYAGVSGPNLETRAEYRFLRNIGGDAVGMSTVPEVIMARYLRMKVLGISVITDMGLPDALKPVSMVKIFMAAKRAEPNLIKIIEGVVAGL